MTTSTDQIIVVGPLTEVTREIQMHSAADEKSVEAGDYTAVKIGDYGTYEDDLIDADGQKIGTLSGKVEVLYQRPSDDHVICWYREEIRLPDGTALFDGAMDFTAAIHGELMRGLIVGTGGRYQGMIGIREVRSVNAKLLTDVRHIFFPNL
jgi:hypothetical protein